MRLYGKIVRRLRVLYYSLYFDIGQNCSIGKVNIFEPEKGAISIGSRVNIYAGSHFSGKKEMPIAIGDGCFINQQCIIRPNVTIGKNVSLGQKVNLISDSHEIGPSEKRAGKPIFQPIVIEEGCWIGAGATVLGNVTIGKGTIIGAGSLVNKDCEPNSLYAGVPAKFIKKLDD